MNMRRLTDDGRYVPANVVELPLQRAKRLTPTPDPTMPTPPKVERDHSADMLGWVLLILVSAVWFACGYFVGAR